MLPRITWATAGELVQRQGRTRCPVTRWRRTAAHSVDIVVTREVIRRKRQQGLRDRRMGTHIEDSCADNALPGLPGLAYVVHACPRWVKHGLEIVQFGETWRQVWSTMANRWSKHGPKWSKMVRHWPSIGQRCSPPGLLDGAALAEGLLLGLWGSRHGRSRQKG